jgi:histidyl-tRNA synthetase
VPEPSIDVWIVDVTGGDVARDLTHELRRAGLSADRSFDGRSMKAQMKAAGRAGARVALIVGESERAGGNVTVRDMRGDHGQTEVAMGDALTYVKKLLEDM